MASSFKTNPIALKELLQDCAVGRICFPDFQRSWVWDEERIRSLIASVSQVSRWVLAHSRYRWRIRVRLFGAGTEGRNAG